MNERTKAFISAAVLVIVDLAAVLGYQLDPTTVTAWVTPIVSVALLVYAAWKDHPFTKAGAAGHALTKSIKDGTYEEPAVVVSGGKGDEGDEVRDGD